MAQSRSQYYAKAYTAGTIACYPEDTALTGTGTVSANSYMVICAGTSTDFVNLIPGEFIVLKTTGLSEVIQIESIDYDRKIIKLKTTTRNAHTAVALRIVKMETLVAQLCYVSVAVKSTATALYFNGNLINPADVGAVKFCFKLDPLVNQPIVVECDAAYIISNAEAIH